MKVGFNLLLWTATVTEDHLGLCKDIKAWGADGVELPMFDTSASPWKTLGAGLDDLGMGRTVVAVLPEGANLISDAAAERQAGLDFLKGCVDAAKELGAEAICGPFYAPVGGLVGRGPTAEEKDRAVESFQALGDFAEGSGIVFGIEALNRFETYFLNTQKDTAELVDRINRPSIQQMYDTFHANIEEKDIAEAIATGGKRIVHVHISANDRGTPGEDHIDYATNIKALKDIGYDGWLTIESFGSRLPELAGATCIWRPMAPSEEHVVREGCKFVRQIWSA